MKNNFSLAWRLQAYLVMKPLGLPHQLSVEYLHSAKILPDLDVLEGADHARAGDTFAAPTVREIFSQLRCFGLKTCLRHRITHRNRVPVATLVGVAALPSLRACVPDRQWRTPPGAWPKLF